MSTSQGSCEAVRPGVPVATGVRGVWVPPLVFTVFLFYCGSNLSVPKSRISAMEHIDLVSESEHGEHLSMESGWAARRDCPDIYL